MGIVFFFDGVAGLRPDIGTVLGAKSAICELPLPAIGTLEGVVFFDGVGTNILGAEGGGAVCVSVIIVFCDGAGVPLALAGMSFGFCVRDEAIGGASFFRAGRTHVPELLRPGLHLSSGGASKYFTCCCLCFFVFKMSISPI